MQADLERGFEALESGDFDTANAIAERCRRIDRHHPDVVMLSAAVADAAGDAETALALYHELAELRPDDAMPRICVARIELRDHDDPDAALDVLESAFEFIDDEADLIEGIVIKAEALLARDEAAAARAVLGELATSVIDDGWLALDLAELCLAAEDPQAARRWIETARTGPGEDEPERELVSDALHLLGRVHEFENDRAAMIIAWQEVRRRDLAAPAGELSVSADEIERITQATLAELPAHIREHLERVPILIDDVPSEELVAEGWDPRLLGLFQGTPMPEDGALAPTVTNIHLFKRNLERSCYDAEHLAEEIRITVLHETAHYFGLDDDDLDELGLG
jgi:predicted Zn-dependent protease with MMP-like domain/thioredoxin-like negative regulator of GroEL